MKAEANDSSQTLNDKSAEEMNEAEIDGNLEDSFPASNPPAWTLGSDHHPGARHDGEDNGIIF